MGLNGKNLASGVLASSVASSATTLSVNCGTGSSSTLTGVWPSAPFYVTVMPARPSAGVANSLDSEIMQVTEITSNGTTVTMTVSRGKKGTTAKSFGEGSIVTYGIYIDDILDRIYPVGSIYMSATLSTATQVANALGGAWVAWGSGKIPVGVDTNDTDFDTVEKTGGEKTHTLTESELPKIGASWAIHGQENGTFIYQQYGHANGNAIQGKYADGGAHHNASASYTLSWKFGGDGAHNNLQPYITCYMYKRTA